MCEKQSCEHQHEREEGGAGKALQKMGKKCRCKQMKKKKRKKKRHKQLKKYLGKHICFPSS